MKITINLEKARNIKRTKIAEEAKLIMAQLTQDFMLALQLSDANKQAEISKKTKILANVYKDNKIDLITDLEELKNYTPDSFNQ